MSETADVFTQISRETDKQLWLVEAQMRADFDHILVIIAQARGGFSKTLTSSKRSAELPHLVTVEDEVALAVWAQEPYAAAETRPSSPRGISSWT